ncbi:MAG: hemerythrin domain-containing protein [Phocaeicola sp.]
MYKVKYMPTDKMSDLICDNYSLLQVLSRFGLSLGFGDQTVKEVCERNNVDCTTFLSVVNFITEEGGQMTNDEVKKLSIPSLMSYLHQAHHYFLDFQFPAIRSQLMEAIGCSSQNELALLIIKFFDAYVAEVRKHMAFEDQNVFLYVKKLLANEKTEGYSIASFARNHDQINSKLSDLKNILIKYYPAKENNHLLNATLFDIFSCEQDLIAHNLVEDLLFVPAVFCLEKEEK